jgi:hypothetical protein
LKPLPVYHSTTTNITISTIATTNATQQRKKKNQTEASKENPRDAKRRRGTKMYERPTRSRPSCIVAVRTTNKHTIVQSECIDPRTTTRRNFANALVIEVGHKHVATGVDGHIIRRSKASVGAESVGISTNSAIDPTRKR